MTFTNVYRVTVYPVDPIEGSEWTVHLDSGEFVTLKAGGIAPTMDEAEADARAWIERRKREAARASERSAQARKFAVDA